MPLLMANRVRGPHVLMAYLDLILNKDYFVEKFAESTGTLHDLIPSQVVYFSPNSCSGTIDVMVVALVDNTLACNDETLAFHESLRENDCLAQCTNIHFCIT